MKKLYTLLFILSSFFIRAQAENTEVASSKNVVSKITSLKYATSSIKELESINWQEVKSVFETNKPEEKIELSFEINLPQSKNKFKSSVTVGGLTKQIDSLIIKSKKAIKAFVKISINYENN